jgi:hypothetical protein
MKADIQSGSASGQLDRRAIDCITGWHAPRRIASAF